MEDDRGRYRTHSELERIPNKEKVNNYLRAAGDAYVELETLDDQDDALRMHKRDMGTRWIYTVVMHAKQKQQQQQIKKKMMHKRNKSTM